MAEDQQIEETVRVSQSRLDRLLQVTGRMIVQQSRINMAREQFGAMSEDLEFEDKANHIIRDIDDIGAKNSAELLGIVQEIRQVEIRTLFNRFTRVVRDVARARDKKVELIIEGGETLVDKSTCEGLSDPLLHMIRNSCDHGLENPEGRADAGKSETGIVTLSARSEREGTIIDIMDDGKGLDVDRIKEKAVEKGLYTMAEIESMDRKEILNFIFLAGFSTAAKVTDLSGRGVGMDVVRTNIEAMGGTAQIKSSEPGKGTTIELWVPLISAVNIVSGFVVEVGNILYILPLSSVAAAVQVDADDVHPVQGGEILMYQGNAVPIVSISKYVGLNGREFGGDKKKTELVVVIRQKAELLALEVDAFLGSQQVVLDDLNDSFSAWALRQGGGVSGTSLLGDGRIALVLEPKILFEMSNIPPEEWQQFLQSTFDVEQEADTKKTKSSAGDEMNAEEDEIVRVDLDIEETGRKRINMVPNIQTHLVGAYAKGQKILRIDLQLERDLMQADRKPNEVIEDLEKHGTVLSILPFGAQEVPDLENFEPAAFDMPFTIFMVVDANEIES
ncbi:MAG: chemotaxis protein CheW, partial [Candidatus Lindowbacteria bacterium]|nr:chemotaxis protein CheW [Candidatus Lindowbacteria bacterium]